MGYWLLYWLGRQCLEGRLWQSGLPLGQRRRWPYHSGSSSPSRGPYSSATSSSGQHQSPLRGCGKGAIQLSSKDVAVKAGGTSHTHHHIIYKLLCNLMCIINHIISIYMYIGVDDKVLRLHNIHMIKGYILSMYSMQTAY